MRGEYPDGQPAITSSLGSPPLARGIRFKREIFSPSIRITPACAGNTLQSFPFSFVCEDHPRLRGEYNHLTACIYHPQGSPPLARGILWLRGNASVCKGITPACAGNTRCFTIKAAQAKDHPRLRGEYHNPQYACCREEGSPPLARGIRCRNVSFASNLRITPACAGNTGF